MKLKRVRLAGALRSQGFLKVPKKRGTAWLQACSVVALAAVIALQASLAPVQAASNTALKWTPQSIAQRVYRGIAWSPTLGMFAAVNNSGSGNILTSTDGVTWTSRSTSTVVGLSGVTWSSTLNSFLAISPGGHTYLSTDGVIWNESAVIAGTSMWQDVTWSPAQNLFVAVACGVDNIGCETLNGNRVATSPDGITWTPRPAAANLHWWNVDWSDNLGLFVATARNGGTQGVMTSPDGITWTSRTTPSGQWYGLTYSPSLNRYVAVSLDGKAMTSSDAITWTQQTISEANQWTDVSWSPTQNLFVAVSQTGTNRIMTSPDGITWTPMAAPSNRTWYKITWSPALQAFAAVSGDGYAMTGSMVTATTTAPSNIGETTAKLQGTYADNYPGATVFFRYRVAGSGGAFTSTPPQTANAAGTYTADISGLSPDTTYEYTIVVQWPSVNGTQELEGGLETFTTDQSKVYYRKTVSPAVTSITPGQTFTYTVTVENQGTTTLNGLSFTDDLTEVIDDATYDNNVNASIGTATWNGSDQISWNGNLNAGQTATITYSFTMNTPDTGDGQLINGIVGTGPQSNCTATPAVDPDCRTMSPLPVLATQKTLLSPTNPKAGDTVNYQFVITNTGAAGATNLAIADDLSQALDDAIYNNDAVASSGTITYDSTSQRLLWSGDLAASGSPGDNVTVTYSVKVNAADNLADAILNNAVISPDCPPTPIFDTSDPDYQANCVTSTAVAAWTARKTDSIAGNAVPGTTATYTITVENTGAVDLTGADAPAVTDDLTDVLDDATYNNDAAATVGNTTYSSPTLSWTSDLAAGQASTITYSATVKPADQLGNSRLVNAVTGSMNCPATAITDPNDSNFNADCAVLANIVVTPSATSPSISSPNGGLANTGRSGPLLASGAFLLFAIGVFLSIKSRSFLKGNK